jgi:NarL family two-component system response regulator LiaR
VSTIRVLLVDQNDDFLDAVLAWLGGAATVEVVGRSHTGAEAVARVETLAPDVVVMDVALPDMSGLDATRQIKRRAGAPVVILTSFHGSRAARAVAADAGADECLSKADITADLLPAIARLALRRGVEVGVSIAARAQRERVASVVSVERAAAHSRPKEWRKR